MDVAVSKMSSNGRTCDVSIDSKTLSTASVSTVIPHKDL